MNDHSALQPDELVKGVNDLAPLPRAYLRIQELVADPDSTLTQVTEVISNEPALTSRILRIANSAYMALAAKVETISRAVQVLGLDQVHDLALASAAVGSMFKVKSEVLPMHQYWRRSIYCAVVARILARRHQPRSTERVFVAGLLHDIGHLVLANKAPAAYRETHDLAISRNQPVYKVERRILGWDYALLGERMLQAWNLPQGIVEPVGMHTSPLDGISEEKLCAIGAVQAGAAISRAALWKCESDEPVPDFDPVVLDYFGLSDADIEAVMSEADEAVVEAMALLLPDARAAA